MRVKNNWLITTGAAALISSATVTTAVAKDKLGKCFNINSCHGQSACSTAESSCAGQNTCQGKGWIKISKSACDNEGGEFKPLK